MKKDIETLIKIAADYHRFVSFPASGQKVSAESDALSDSELDLIAAARSVPLRNDSSADGSGIPNLFKK